MSWMKQKEEQADLEAVGSEIIKNLQIDTVNSLLSMLYHKLCRCRKTKLLNPNEHGSECEYKKQVEPIGLEFE